MLNSPWLKIFSTDLTSSNIFWNDTTRQGDFLAFLAWLHRFSACHLCYCSSVRQQFVLFCFRLSRAIVATLLRLYPFISFENNDDGISVCALTTVSFPSPVATGAIFHRTGIGENRGRNDRKRLHRTFTQGRVAQACNLGTFLGFQAK